MSLVGTITIVVAGAMGFAVLWIVVLFIRKWEITLSPKETASYTTIIFSMGYMACAYLDGVLVQVLEAAAVIGIFFVWWVIRFFQRFRNRKQETAVR